MSALLAPAPLIAPARTPAVDNRIAYLGFALAYLLGHGGTALTLGGALMPGLPAWLPIALLVLGLTVGTAASISSGIVAQRTMSPSAAREASLIGMAWISGFAGLFLVISGLVAVTGDSSLQTILWPTASGFLVGLIYLAEGAVRRDPVHYALGTLLILVAPAVLFLPTAVALGTLAIVGGGAYVLAFLLIQRRGRHRGTLVP
jgi:hypothetical protein